MCPAIHVKLQTNLAKSDISIDFCEFDLYIYTQGKQSFEGVNKNQSLSVRLFT